jgi:hypothetical protein
MITSWAKLVILPSCASRRALVSVAMDMRGRGRQQRYVNSAAGRPFSLQRNLQEVADSRELLQASTVIIIIIAVIMTLICGYPKCLCLVSSVSCRWHTRSSFVFPYLQFTMF